MFKTSKKERGGGEKAEMTHFIVFTQKNDISIYSIIYQMLFLH